MSMSLVQQLYTEARRLMIAGSGVAAGDFRLKKQIPPLRQLAPKAPVFGKLADAAQAVVDAPESASAQALLELATLTTAILSTQGTSTQEGAWIAPETKDRPALSTQTPARMLEPILDALTTTGSGRLEILRQAIDLKLFQDLRLIAPALNALDDRFSDIAELIREQVLPQYGRGILPAVRAKYDPQGTAGAGRRLTLMHQLDPEGTRPLVLDALEQGSKEVKIFAIACLGDHPQDLAYLLEQAQAKTKDVRLAACTGLAKVDHPDSWAVFEKIVQGKDLSLFRDAVQKFPRARLTQILADAATKDFEAWLAAKPQTAATVQAGLTRLFELLHAFPQQMTPPEATLLSRWFRARAQFHGLKGESLNGSALTSAIAERMLQPELKSQGDAELRRQLLAAADEDPAPNLLLVILAGRWILSPREFFDRFAKLLERPAGKSSGKKKTEDAREVLLDALQAKYVRIGALFDSGFPPLDLRWADAAVAQDQFQILARCPQQRYPQTDAYLSQKLEKLLTQKTGDTLEEVLSVMIYVQHPEATAAVLNTFFKVFSDKTYFLYGFRDLIARLPATAIPELEAALSRVPDRLQGPFSEAIESLRQHHLALATQPQ